MTTTLRRGTGRGTGRSRHAPAAYVVTSTVTVTLALSTVTVTVAVPVLDDVSVEVAVPSLVVADGGLTDPRFVENPTGMPSGTTPSPEVLEPAEFSVSEAVIVALSDVVIEVGEALAVSVSRGV